MERRRMKKGSRRKGMRNKKKGKRRKGMREVTSNFFELIYRNEENEGYDN